MAIALASFFFLSGCSVFGPKELQVNTVCPPYPPGGPKVGEELARIPYNGWPLLGAIAFEIEIKCKAGDQQLCEMHEKLAPIITDMKPEQGFEHLYNWLGRIRVLAMQLERCKSD